MKEEFHAFLASTQCGEEWLASLSDSFANGENQ
jgi:hypothetical protein